MKVVHYPKIEGAEDIQGFVYQGTKHDIKVGASIADIEDDVAARLKQTYPFLSVIDQKVAEKAQELIDEAEKPVKPARAARPKPQPQEVEMTEESAVEPESVSQIPTNWNELVKLGMRLGVYKHKMDKIILTEAIEAKLKESE